MPLDSPRSPVRHQIDSILNLNTKIYLKFKASQKSIQSFLTGLFG